MGFSCCGTFIDNENNFNSHQKLRHFPTSKFKNSNFQCPICSTFVNRLDNYRDHLILKHISDVSDIFSRFIRPIQQPPSLSEHSNLEQFQPRSNPIEVIRSNISNIDSNDFDNNCQFDDIEPMECSDTIYDFNQDDIPFFEKDENNHINITNENDGILITFAKLLTSLKCTLNVAQKHLNTIVSAILSFVSILINLNLLTINLINELKKVSKSAHFQEKHSSKIKLIKHRNYDFYYCDLKEVVQRYLANKEICEQLLREKLSKFFFDSTQHSRGLSNVLKIFFFRSMITDH